MTPRWIAAGAIVVVLAGGCGSSSDEANSGASATTTTAPTDVPVYATPGPSTVGYTLLRMDGRDVHVWYPADAASTEGKTKATYDQKTALPEKYHGLVPDKYNAVTTMNAYADVPGDTSATYPVVMFSHGFGGYPLVNSANAVGIASWGFVVASVDYFERGLVNQIENKDYPRDPGRDPRLALASLDLLTAANDNANSVLHGIVDATKVGGVGHSAGGRTVFDALQDPRVGVAVGYAPVGPTDAPAEKPTMIIGASLDNALTSDELAKTYASFPEPKRLVEIMNAGHNSFTDICPVIRAGGGLVQFAVQNKIISEDLAALAFNGCEPGDLEPEKFLPVVQHFTVAALRDGLKIDAMPVGLGDGIANAFPGITVNYQHQP